MLEVTIPCHPLSRRMIIAEFGTEPVQVEKTQVLFGVLAGYAVGQPTARNQALFASKIVFLLPDELAAHVAAFPIAAAERMYAIHKDRVAWYALTFSRANGKGGARAGVRDCLDVFDVAEDEYGVDTAYKLFQRKGWEIDKKNARFSGQIKTKAAEFSARKPGRRAKFFPGLPVLTWSASDLEIELAIGRFLSAHNHRFQSTPSRLPKQVRIYAYHRLLSLSEREVGRKLNIPRTSVQNALHSVRSRSARNPAFQHLIEEMFALPKTTAASAPS